MQKQHLLKEQASSCAEHINSLEITATQKLFSCVVTVCFSLVFLTGVTASAAQINSCGTYDPQIAIELGQQYRLALKAHDYVRLAALKQRKKQIDIWQKDFAECSQGGDAPPLGDGTTGERASTQQQRDCERLRTNLDRAMATECAYNGAHEACRLAGYQVVSWQTMLDLKLDPTLFHENGFHTELLLRDGKYTLAFRGTSFGGRGEGWLDAIDDIEEWGQSLGRTTSQYEQARKLSAHLKTAKISIDHVTGHSLGGGLATVAAITLGVEASVYNPQGLHPAVADDLGLTLDDAQDLVVATVVDGEALTALQDMGAVLIDTTKFGLITQTVLAARFENCNFIFCEVDAPPHPGERITLQPATQDSDASAIDRHGMDAVIRAIEASMQQRGCEPADYGYS